ncbi:DNA primase family protein [Siccirubricoccus deserti]|uniref:SF3 helicase domain-containing protein n=1 Tax=Siccirubricoccus deserti TaxID=2013562 RepID=A0A9X0R2S0_9PROT|nr:DUF5906 domain-containing protein [Siccirubricoccus deserti]MBC4018530.1 hypothetical protein [Siccirubricoccus deserti]
MDDFLYPPERGGDSTRAQDGHDNTFGPEGSDGGTDPGPQHEGLPEHPDAAGSADGPPTTPLRNPSEGSDRIAVSRLLEEAQALEKPSFEEMRGLIRNAREIRATPAEMKVLQLLLAERSNLTTGIIAQFAIDERNRINGFGVIGTPDDAKAAIVTMLLNDFEQLVWSGGSLYGYCGEAEGRPVSETGYFQRISQDRLDALIIQHLSQTTIVESRRQRAELIDRIAAEAREQDFFDNAAPGVNLASCRLFWDGTNFQQSDVSVQNRARERLPFAYDPEAQAPVFNRAIRRVIASEAKRAALQEVFGAVIFGITPKKDAARRIVLLLGGPNSGKSTIIALLQLFVPDYATVSVPPEEWGKEYSRARLEGAILNIVTELGGRQPLAGEQVKRIASCEPVSARHPYGRSFEYRPRAWHLFASNELPRVTDTSPAFERRMLVLNFDRPLERGEIDGDLIERVREELPGVLNWAMEGAKRLAQRGYFLPPPGHHEAVLGMQFGTDPVPLFAHLAVEAAPGDPQGVTTERLRAALKAFAEARGLDTDGWNELTHMKRLADFLNKLYGAERAARDGRPFYRFVKLRAEQGYRERRDLGACVPPVLANPWIAMMNNDAIPDPNLAHPLIGLTAPAAVLFDRLQLSINVSLPTVLERNLTIQSR